MGLKQSGSCTMTAARCGSRYRAIRSPEQDDSVAILVSNVPAFVESNISLVLLTNQPVDPHDKLKVIRHTRTTNGGCGFGKNRCIEVSRGEFLCFQDADDLMFPRRIVAQLEVARLNPSAIVGCQIDRLPADSTPRYTAWLNSMTQEQLVWQRFREVTLAMPTWFIHRSVFDHVGQFSEDMPHCPEDMIFFYHHTSLGKPLIRVDEQLLTYRYHANAQHLAVSSQKILACRAQALESEILQHWPTFSIWGANKEGKSLFKLLSEDVQRKVVCFYDVSAKKIGGTVTNLNLPVVHFSKAKPPVVTAVKLDLTGGGFERNLQTMGWVEGRDFVFFG
eukprot:c13656_g1_i1.p1 GENE.c13656_g1_i1~~c13656_g1_i1.p1  ORF type:complete len:334 (+),score=64.58 c13656_g1_i1:135-1136(+)